MIIICCFCREIEIGTPLSMEMKDKSAILYKVWYAIGSPSNICFSVPAAVGFVIVLIDFANGEFLIRLILTIFSFIDRVV